MLSSKHSLSHSADHQDDGPLGEEVQLDAAIRQADRLLVSSLQSEERRRGQMRVILFALGGLIMTVTICVIVMGLAVAPDAPDAAAANPEQAAEMSAEGWKLWQAHDFATAAEKFEQAVKLDPKNVHAWNGLGWARFNSGDYQPALAAFEKVIAIEPNYPAAQNGLGQIALAERKYDLAEKHLLKAAPNAPAAWYGLAKLYLLKGEYDKATKWAKKVVDSGESDDTITEMLKAAQEKKVPADLRKRIEAPAGATEAAASAKDLARAWQLMNQGRRPEAKTAFEKLLSANPNDANALNGMGWFLLFGGETDQAKPCFEKAIAADPKAAGAMNGLARVLYAQGDADGAIKIWQDMVEKIPGPHAGVYGLADAYLEKGEFQKAVPLLERLTKANPKDQQLKEKLNRARKGGTE